MRYEHQSNTYNLMMKGVLEGVVKQTMMMGNDHVSASLESNPQKTSDLSNIAISLCEAVVVALGGSMPL